MTTSALSPFTSEHDLFRKSVRDFLDKEVVPHIDEWEAAEVVPRRMWKRLVELGFLGLQYPESCGYGYMEEFPIARAFRDNRLIRIAGGSDEIMKEIVAKMEGLRE